MSASTVTHTQSDQPGQEATQITPVETPSIGRIGAWLSRLFVAVILIAIPLVYYFGYLDATWLNRIGIILNFCAGFMLAPELLGIKRLETIETQLEKLSTNIATKTHDGVAALNRMISKLYLDGVKYTVTNISWQLLAILCVACSLATFDYRYYLYAAITITTYYLINVYIGIYSTKNHRYIKRRHLQYYVRANKSTFSVRYPLKKFIKRDVLSIKSVEILLYWTTFSFVIVIMLFILFIASPFICVIWLFIKSVNVVALSLISRLTGDARLRTYLILYGVIVFIIGNLLQFLATF